MVKIVVFNYGFKYKLNIIISDYGFEDFTNYNLMFEKKNQITILCLKKKNFKTVVTNHSFYD